MDHLLFGVDWKTAGPDTGELTGYMSVFGNVDQGNDVVMPGAFRKTFAEWSRAKSPMPLIADHQLDTSGVIGSVAHMAEDNVGAKIRAKFSSVQKAQEIRTKMVEGHLRGLSFTYEPVQHTLGVQDGKKVRFLKEVKVFEATVTPFPMNQLALADAKASSNPKKPYGDVAYADPGYQEDGVSRYPLDTEQHIRAGWSYINKSENQKPYTADQLDRIMGKLRAAMRRIGAQMAESSSVDFDTFEQTLTKILAIPDLYIRKTALDMWVPRYHPETDAAELADGQPTADAAADTEPPAVDTAETKTTAAAYAVSLITPGPSDETPVDPATYSERLLENARIDAEADALEESIKQALGANA